MIKAAAWMLAVTLVVIGMGRAYVGNMALFVSGVIIFSFCIYSCGRRWASFAVVDILLFLIGVFFGALAIIDALLNDLSHLNPYVIVLTHIHVGIITGLILVSYLLLPERITEGLQIDFLMSKLEKAQAWPVAVITGLAVFFRIYGYLKFGIISGMPWDYLAKNSISLPYWYTSSLMVAKIAVTYAFCVSAVRIISNPGGIRYFWAAVIVICMAYEAIDSRRGLFYLIVIGGVFWALARNVNPFQGRHVWIWIMIGLFLFGGSNVFQTYRFLLFNPMLREGIKDASLVDAIFDTEATLSNLRGREATWRFNYRIINAQMENPSRFLPFGMYGGMTVQALRNSIPSKLLRGKQVRQAEDLASMEYGLLVEDYSGNIFANTAADWGILSVIFVPLTFLVLTMTYYWLSRRGLAGESMPGLLLVGILVYFLRVEASVDDFWILYRNLFMIGGCYYCLEYVRISAGRKFDPAGPAA